MEKGGDLGLARVNEGDNVGGRLGPRAKDRLAVAPPHGHAVLSELS
jgi:hypothetical protein